eukprot:TRINITY_DN48109_c0_g1_i1.p1 TRINITY_DN48109_c0_g1~~TRINITY_DN48109_c0_g1_i1.p1  ORF type:complete len:290 (+),score=74.14 TRINITY_DN48109_c0_g1_i1:77-946(+)
MFVDVDACSDVEQLRQLLKESYRKNEALKEEVKELRRQLESREPAAADAASEPEQTGRRGHVMKVRIGGSGGENRVFEASSMAELVRKTQEKFKLDSIDGWTFKYHDDENWISLSSQVEFDSAIEFLTESPDGDAPPSLVIELLQDQQSQYPRASARRGRQEPGGKLSCRFVRDANLTDNSKVGPGEEITKRWIVRNDGERDWPKDVFLAHIGGDVLARGEFPVAGGTAAGEEVAVSATFSTPQAEGRYQYYFKLRVREPDGRAGRKFGQRLWVIVNVSSESAAAGSRP